MEADTTPIDMADIIDEMKAVIPQYAKLDKFMMDGNYFRASAFKSYIPKKTPLSYDLLDKLFTCFFYRMQNNPVSQQTNWSDNTNPQEFFHSILSAKKEEEVPFRPYMQKMVVAPGSEKNFQGDLHGDVHSLLETLQGLQEKGYLDDNYKIIKDNFYLAFLGDYVDKGIYGIEVISLILYLKCLNFDNVLLVRGNHEDWTICGNEAFGSGELPLKFPKENDELRNKIQKMYECLPVAIFYGVPDANNITNYALLCHGGVEMGVDTHNLLPHPKAITFEQIKTIDRVTQANKLKALERYKQLIALNACAVEALEREIFRVNSFVPEILPDVGFAWNDYYVKPDDKRNNEDGFKWAKIYPGRGIIIGELFNQLVLEAYSTEHHKVRVVIRGHQHNNAHMDEMMQSVFKKKSFGQKQTKESAIDLASNDYYENKGVSKLWLSQSPPHAHSVWPNLVCTINVSPCTFYQNVGIVNKGVLSKIKHKFNFATVGILKTAASFEDWKLTVVRKEIFGKDEFQLLQNKKNSKN